MLPDLIPSEEVSRTRDAASAVLAELKRSCRDPDFELQLTAHMALFTLLDAFAEQQHPAAPIIFKVMRETPRRSPSPSVPPSTTTLHHHPSPLPSPPPLPPLRSSPSR